MLTPDGSPREGQLREFPLQGRDLEVHALVQSLQDHPHPLDRVAEFFGRCGIGHGRGVARRVQRRRRLAPGGTTSAG